MTTFTDPDRYEAIIGMARQLRHVYFQSFAFSENDDGTIIFTSITDNPERRFIADVYKKGNCFLCEYYMVKLRERPEYF